MSANVDQRSKGQPSQVSNGANKDVIQHDEQYMQQPPQHQMRLWSDQTTDTPYGAPPMSTANVSESFFQNFYPPSMTYPFMSQGGLSGSEGSWSNGTDTMFGMGYDYSNVYGNFGFPFNSWDYTNDYWGTSQGVRKDQRSYPTDEGYYPPEMIPPDAYGMMNGAPVPPEPQEPIGTIEQGIRGMTITQSNSLTVDSSSRKKVVDVNQLPVMSDNFSGRDSSHMMSPSHSQSVQSSIMCGGIPSQSKKTSWAAIASQPARPQQQLRPRTIPRAPVNPNRPHMDIGTWDGRGNPSKTPLLPPQQPSSQPSQPRQTWTASTSRNNNSRQAQPYSNSGPGNESVNSITNQNSNNSSSGTSTNQGNLSNHSPSYSNYSNNAGGSTGTRSSPEDDNTTTNGDNYIDSSSASSHPILDQLKSSNFYNPKEFNLNSKSARFFIIKSYSEDDIHRSIKYNIWCSTDHGNQRLDAAFREREGKGPLYLIYSVNGSGHFCGIAQMMSPVDYSRSAGVWAQDKWKGQFTVKWVYVKDVPNSQLRHIRLENNENKPVTNSRDAQEVPPEQGKQVLRIVHSYKHTTSIFDDFTHYEKRQEQDANSGSQQRDHRNDSRGDHRGGERDHRGGDRDNRGGERDHRGGDRDHRGGDRDHRGGDRDNRGGDRDNRGGDRDKDNRGGDRDHRGVDRDNRGGDRDYRGGDRDHRGGDRDHRGGDRDRDGPGNRNRDNRRGGQDGDGRSGRQN